LIFSYVDTTSGDRQGYADFIAGDVRLDFLSKALLTTDQESIMAYASIPQRLSTQLLISDVTTASSSAVALMASRLPYLPHLLLWKDFHHFLQSLPIFEN